MKIKLLIWEYFAKHMKLVQE